MTKRIGRVARCYRCLHRWRIRGRGKPSLCPRCKSRLYATPPTPSAVSTRRLYDRLARLPPPTWDGLGPIRWDDDRRRAKDELLAKSGMRTSTNYGRR
jgi:hypothetical protein